MLNREDMIKMLDLAIENLPKDHASMKCMCCGTFPEPASMTIGFDPVAKPRFSVYSWIMPGWLWLNESGIGQKPICAACVKEKKLRKE